MGQVQTFPHTSGQTQRSFSSVRQQSIYSRRIEHQGLLTLRQVPFKNCIQIQTASGSIFLQNIEITLKDLLDSRIYTNQLFPKEDIERLIENITYTLAYLAENGVPYKDISSENIFYDDGVFKLLPNELIQQSRYQRFLMSRKVKKPYTSTLQSKQDGQFITLSPQMIIAYRCKQPLITELEILDKSNVFCLGLILMQTCTLLPSYECYDEETCDILDEIIMQRLQLVKEYYTQEIAAIVANMLDYDYSERMGLKEVSIFVNRQLNRDLISNSKIVRELSNKKQPRPQLINEIATSSDPMVDDGQSLINHSQTKTVSICKSRLQHTEQAESQISRPSNTVTVPQKKRNKTNRVYMNGGLKPQPEEESITILNPKEERNKVYMKQTQLHQQMDSKRQYNHQQEQSQRPHTVLRQISHINNNAFGLCSQSRLQPQVGKMLNINSREKCLPSISTHANKGAHYRMNNEEEQQNRYPYQQDCSQSREMKRKNSTDYLGYRVNNKNAVSKTPKQQKSIYHAQSQNHFDFREQYDQKQSFNNNNYNYKNSNDSMKQDSDFAYPQQRKQSSFGHRYQPKESPMSEDSGSRGYFQASKPSNAKNDGSMEFKDHDNSLNRIKSEIQRSRKLIEEFKRGENVQFS